MRFSDLDGPLAAEIRQEMAASYFAECKKMVASLKALSDFDRIHATAPATEKQITRRSELVEVAAQRVHFVIIQREALQLLGGDQFFKEYQIPDDVRKRLGPKR